MSWFSLYVVGVVVFALVFTLLIRVWVDDVVGGFPLWFMALLFWIMVIPSLVWPLVIVLLLALWIRDRYFPYRF